MTTVERYDYAQRRHAGESIAEAESRVQRFFIMQVRDYMVGRERTAARLRSLRKQLWNETERADKLGRELCEHIGPVELIVNDRPRS